MPTLLAQTGASILGGPVGYYIQSQRDSLLKNALPLPEQFQIPFASYFEAELLRDVRLVTPDQLRLPGISFRPLLHRLGLEFPDPQYVAGITFDNVVAINGAAIGEEFPSARLLFHELVHVAQYQLLGIRMFAHLYVRGFLRYGTYEDIPLERCAWELDARFSDVREPFSVGAAVAQWADSNLF